MRDVTRWICCPDISMLFRFLVFHAFFFFNREETWRHWFEFVISEPFPLRKISQLPLFCFWSFFWGSFGQNIISSMLLGLGNIQNKLTRWRKKGCGDKFPREVEIWNSVIWVDRWKMENNFCPEWLKCWWKQRWFGNYTPKITNILGWNRQFLIS